MLSGIVEAFREELARPEVEVLLGADHVAAHGKPLRIVWVPVSDYFSPPARVGGNPRQLYTRNASVTLHIWGADLEATEQLLHDTVAALYRTVSAPGLELQPTQWLDDKGGLVQHGEVVLLNIALQIPVFDQPRTTATITTTETAGEYTRPGN